MGEGFEAGEAEEAAASLDGMSEAEMLPSRSGSSGLCSNVINSTSSTATLSLVSVRNSCSMSPIEEFPKDGGDAMAGAAPWAMRGGVRRWEDLTEARKELVKTRQVRN